MRKKVLILDESEWEKLKQANLLDNVKVYSLIVKDEAKLTRFAKKRWVYNTDNFGKIYVKVRGVPPMRMKVLGIIEDK